MYPRRSDLSPNGELLVYFCLNGASAESKKPKRCSTRRKLGLSLMTFAFCSSASQRAKGTNRIHLCLDGGGAARPEWASHQSQPQSREMLSSSSRCTEARTGRGDGEKRCDIFVTQLGKNRGRRPTRKAERRLFTSTLTLRSRLGCEGSGISNLPVPTIKSLVLSSLCLALIVGIFLPLLQL